MSNYKTGLLTALKNSYSVMPQVVIQFDDATTGKKAKQLLDHNNPVIRAEAAAASITDTLDNNRIGTISDYVAVLWDKVAQSHPNYISKLSIDEQMKQIGQILKSDAQVNLSIDFAKKRPDMEGLEWIRTKRNPLESEVHKHAGTKNPKMSQDLGRDFYYPMLPTEEGETKGIYGIPCMIHDYIKDIPETKGLSVTGYSFSGHDIFVEDEHEDVDISTMLTALWNVEGELEEDINRETISERLDELATRFEGRLQNKLYSLSEKVMRKWTLTSPDADINEIIGLIKDFADVAEKELPIQQIYTIAGLLVMPKNPELGWKLLSNNELITFATRIINGIKQAQDQSLSDSLLNAKRMIHLWAKSWAMAQKENGIESDAEEAADNLEDEEETAKAASEALAALGF